MPLSVKPDDGAFEKGSAKSQRVVLGLEDISCRFDLVDLCLVGEVQCDLLEFIVHRIFVAVDDDLAYDGPAMLAHRVRYE